MYAEDMPQIRDFALASSDNLAKVITFVVLTIQQPFHTVGRMMADVDQHGQGSKWLFGHKRKAFSFCQENAGYLHRVALDILAREDGEHRRADLIQHFMQVPGLGIVKAAFVAQLIGGGTACLDMHNLTVLGMPEDAFKVKSKLPEKIRAQVLTYVRLCDRQGGAEHWWNRWCHYVAGRRGSPLKDGEAVSRFHVECFGLA